MCVRCASGVASCSGAGKWSNSVGRVNGTHNNKYVQFAYKQTHTHLYVKCIYLFSRWQPQQLLQTESAQCLEN